MLTLYAQVSPTWLAGKPHGSRTWLHGQPHGYSVLFKFTRLTLTLATLSHPECARVCAHTSQIYFTYILMHSHIQFHLYTLTLSSHSHAHRHSDKHTHCHPHTHSCSHTHIHTSPLHTCTYLPSQFSDTADSGQREESAALTAWKNTEGLFCVSLSLCPAMVTHLGIWEASVTVTFRPCYSQALWCLGLDV